MSDRPLQSKAIARIVVRQLGHITRWQLFGAGLTGAQIDHLVARGEQISVHLGVYAVGHVPRHAHARSVAAVLACGDGAVLSHSAAAALWGVAEWPPILEVTSRAHHRPAGIRAHRSTTLTSADVRRHHGVPVTGPARTALDLQRRLTEAGLARLVNELRAGGHLGPAAFAGLCTRSVRIDRLLGERGTGRTLTRSELERAFRAFARRHRLPEPGFNVKVPELGREVDVLYREARLIIEIDSWRHHSDRVSFEGDRGADLDALARGYATVRVTHHHMRRGGGRTAALIREISTPADGAPARPAESQYSPSPRR